MHNDASQEPASTKEKYMQADTSGACRQTLQEHAGRLFRSMQADSSGACRQTLQVHAGILFKCMQAGTTDVTCCNRRCQMNEAETRTELINPVPEQELAEMC